MLSSSAVSLATQRRFNSTLSLYSKTNFDYFRNRVYFILCDIILRYLFNINLEVSLFSVGQMTTLRSYLSHTEASRGLLAPKPPGADGKGDFSGLLVMGNKDSYIKIRLSKSEKERWQEKAVLAGVSLSNLIRQAMVRTSASQ